MMTNLNTKAAEVKTFESVPVTISAVQFRGIKENATAIINWILDNGGSATWREEEEIPKFVGWDITGSETEPEALYIHTLEGIMKASVGDWIIRGLEGEFYPCKDSVFQKKYKEIN